VQKQKTAAMNTKMPVLQIRHRDGENWFVAATWPDGRFEEIQGFKTESEANEWIAKEFQAWLDKRRETERTDA
jgi:hypothetical protein